MLIFETNGKKAVPNDVFDGIQRENLQSIKNTGQIITGTDKLTTFDKNIRYKNVVRKNSDGSEDIIVSADVVDELPTGSFVKRTYKALRVKKQKSGLLDSLKSDYEIIQVPSSDIVSQFTYSYSVDEIEKILENITKKGVNYFG